MNKRVNLFFAVILVLSFYLRINSLYVGLPSVTGRLSTFHFDEYITFDALGKMNPSKFDFYPSDALYWGTFQVYLQGFVLKSMEIFGFFKKGDKRFYQENLKEADKMYISGRIITVFFSLLSIIVIFLISKEFLDGYYVLIPPALYGFSYVDVYMASIVKPDVIMIFWGLVSFYFFVKLLRDEKINRKYLIYMAVFNGLSFVSKYTGIIFAFFFGIYILMKMYKTKKYLEYTKYMIYYFVIVFMVFIIVNPYFIIRNQDCIKYMKGMLSKSYINGDILSGYMEYFTEILPVAIGWPYWVLGILSIFILIFKKDTDIRIKYSIWFVLFYYLKFGYAHNQAFTYSLPTVPFLAFISGYFIYRIKNYKKIVYSVFFVVLFYNFSYSYYMKSKWSNDNTITKSSRWIENNIDKKSPVCLSRIEIWTPVVLRKYNSDYNINIFSPPSFTFAKGIERLLKNYDKCDYIILSEYESNILNKEFPEKKDVIYENFENLAVFKRPRNKFFITSDSLHYLFAIFMNPDVYIYKKIRK